MARPWTSDQAPIAAISRAAGSFWGILNVLSSLPRFNTPRYTASTEVKAWITSEGSPASCPCNSGPNMRRYRAGFPVPKRKPADALKAILITYLRFGTGNPARYRLMFGPELQGQDAGLPSEVIHAFTSVEAVYRGVLKRGSEDRTFKIPQNDPAALEMAAIGAWSLVHGLAMLYIDGLATLETAQTIDSLAEEVIAMFMHGIVKREKQD